MTAPQLPAPKPRRRRVEYTADFENKFDRFLEKLNHVEISIESLRGLIMPRPEITMEIEKRVPLATYTSDKLNNEERFKRLEDAPSATWSRAGILISGGIGCAGVLIGCVSILVSILIATHVI